MMTTFWDKISEAVAEGWNLRLLLPAFAFWFAGLLAWLLRFGFTPLSDFLKNTDTTQGILLAVAGLLVLAGSAWLAKLAAAPLLRLAEGYWPSVFKDWRFSRAQTVAAAVQVQKDRWQVLAHKYQTDRANMTIAEIDEYAQLDAGIITTTPRKANLFLPTRLGNLLRAAEEYPDVRYGLEVRLTWARLWLVLPDSARKEIASARAALDDRTQWLLWSLLLLLWTVWCWWALLPALAGAFIAYRSMLTSAGVYGELLRAAYDLYRFDLYKAVHWSPPATSDSEEACGKALTQYLHRGALDKTIVFQP